MPPSTPRRICRPIWLPTVRAARLAMVSTIPWRRLVPVCPSGGAAPRHPFDGAHEPPRQPEFCQLTNGSLPEGLIRPVPRVSLQLSLQLRGEATRIRKVSHEGHLAPCWRDGRRRLPQRRRTFLENN